MSARKSTRRAKAVGKGLERWFPLVDNVLLLLGLAVVLSLSYLLWIILRGDLAYPLIGGTQLDVVRNGLDWGRQALLWSLWLLLLLALVRHYRNETIGYLAMAAGAALWLGMPMLIARYSPATTAKELQDVAELLITSFRATGVAFVVIGVVRVVGGRIVALTYLPQGATVTRLTGQFGPPQPEAPSLSGRSSLMRKCWELHFCRGSLRTSCPRFQESVPCWRKRSGCYCDHELAGHLMSSIGGNASVKLQVAEELEGQQRRAQELQRRAKQQRSRAMVRKLCRECPIYNEHQKFKYRALSWVAYPLTVLIVALSANSIRAGYEWSDLHATEIVSKYNIIPHYLTDKPLQVAPWLSAENFSLVVIGVIVLATILHFTEMAVFRFKM